MGESDKPRAPPPPGAPPLSAVFWRIGWVFSTALFNPSIARAFRPFAFASVMCGWYARASGTNPHPRVAAVTFCSSASISAVTSTSAKKIPARSKNPSPAMRTGTRSAFTPQPLHYARRLFRARLAQKLQRHMPRRFARPPHALAARRRKPLPHAAERRRRRSIERNPHKQSHRRFRLRAHPHPRLMPRRMLRSRCAGHPQLRRASPRDPSRRRAGVRSPLPAARLHPHLLSQPQRRLPGRHRSERLCLRIARRSRERIRERPPAPHAAARFP